MTSSISPEYFAIAKQVIVTGAGWRALGVGARAGAGAATLLALVIVVMDEPRWGGANASWRACARRALGVVIASAVCAGVSGVVGGSRVALPISIDDVARLGVTRPAALRAVWAAHAGAYAGAIAATIVQATWARFRAGPASPSPC